MDAIISPNNILFVLSELEDESLFKEFCGTVYKATECFADPLDLSQWTVYLCGDLSTAKADNLRSAARVLVIRELSYGCIDSRSTNWTTIDLGQVPIHTQGVGVFYRRFFDSDCNYFNRVTSEHTLQSLFESTKPQKAHRKGIYLTDVKQSGTELHFRLLRCSTNLSGPTNNFRSTDRYIVDALNEEAEYIFQNQGPLNHVLAQTYPNVPASDGQKQAKAKISAHADKTKDMPRNAVMAFCTFYDRLDKLSPLAGTNFDYGCYGVSGLTKLRFRLKESVRERGKLPLQFTVTLYPNSVFFIPLSTNRLYTHEIQASELDAELLPTRLGYVVRCSSTEAVHDSKSTFLKIGGKRVKLQPPTADGMKELRNLYAQENGCDMLIDYGNRFLFSMNEGDYKAPDYSIEDEFCVYDLPEMDGVFEALSKCIRFEAMGKGREGAVLVNTNQTGDIPIVRTTSKYAAPAQTFPRAYQQLAEQIRKYASLPCDLNNALVEKYTNAYTTMGFHSDQALDLAHKSHIAVFSCYEYPESVKSPRTLVVESKETGASFEIPMKHNSVIIFSTDTNRRFKHKIILSSSTSAPSNTWLGVTLRTSKTFVQIRDGNTYLPDSTPLVLASEQDCRAFYQIRGRENREVDFTYPPISYTISKSDLMSVRDLAKDNEHV